MLGDQAHEVAEDRLALAFREFVIGRQPCRQMLECNGAAGSRCFARHDGLPSSEARNARMLRDMIRDRKESDLSVSSGQNTGVFAVAREASRALLECTLAAHYGIDPGTKQNHNGNVVPFRAAHTEAASAYVCRDAGLRGLALALTKRLPRRRHGCGSSA